ncbi:MAG TPA: aminotransferase class V-fold PLP-dependent enzyme [Gemmatimonadaceae bacterium]|nr:aminotransferase class V-fold PLP-dependent enzyme [Gemmatimonadaceae bacterium]
MNKREFVRTMGGASLGLMFSPEILTRLANAAPTELAEDEAFWKSVRGKYRLTPDYINLENGYYSMQSEPVLEAFIASVRRVNYEAARYFRTVRVDDKARVRDKLAAMAGCSPEELIITRNTTESLDTVISGFDWKPGDEAIMAAQDYGAMLDHFQLMGRRYGLVNKVLQLPVDPRSDDEIVQLYAGAITPRTRLLMISHLVNITGQILPVRKVADMAHARGVEVMVDGAHAFAHLDFRIPDLGADYYGASLHKWLGAPLGAGILYVREDRIEKLWPIYGEEAVPPGSVMKLNHTGTHPSHTDLGIEHAIAFHETIGSARKEARLRWLQQYWTAKVRGKPRIVVQTPADPARSCAIANVTITGMAPADLARTLFEKYRVYTVAINRPEAGILGIRVTPHLFTTTADLDALVRGLVELAA